MTIYRYHKTPVQKLIEDLTMQIQNWNQKTIYIGGDFNLDYNKKATANRLKHELLTPLQLHQIVKNNTTKQQTMIDLVLTNTSTSQSTVKWTYYSDHNMIKIKL